MDIIVRAARLADEEAVVRIWRVCGLLTTSNDPVADFRRAIAGAASSVLVAETAGELLVGTVMVGHDGHRGWLYYVATDPAHRGKGVGRMLVHAGERWSSDREITKLQPLVREANAAVAPFYERLGFKKTPRIVMAKWLTSLDDGC